MARGSASPQRIDPKSLTATRRQKEEGGVDMSRERHHDSGCVQPKHLFENIRHSSKCDAKVKTGGKSTPNARATGTETLGAPELAVNPPASFESCAKPTE